ncbi:MAG: CvpA family protein [Lentisphaerae bacterium]|nr:CvpA family protein [Lentisphaerota bacterium]
MFGAVFNTIDIAAGLMLVIGLIVGSRRGLSVEFPRLINAVLMTLVTLLFYKPLAALLIQGTRLSDSPAAATALAFTLILLGAGIVLLLLRLLFGKVARLTFNESLERPGGLLAAWIRTSLLTAAFIYAIGLWPHDYLHRLFVERSLLGRTLARHAPALVEPLEHLRDTSLPGGAGEP